MILAGDSVRVHPHGAPDQWAIGKVIRCGGSQRAIVIAFDHPPPFARIVAGTDIALPTDVTITFMGYRASIGPWIEIGFKGHYEIETADVVAGESIHCVRCGATSRNLNDVEQLYCGNCHRFHERTAVKMEGALGVEPRFSI